jgi:hypothetical protein
MLVGFLGAPISGKTTTAARLFAGLKDDGYVAEFIPERARYHIAKLRYEAKKANAAPLPLDRFDQRDILYAQEHSEKLFVETSPRSSVIVTDSAALLALLYLPPELRTMADILPVAKRSTARFDLLFRCHPVQPGELYDPNRVHSFEQSRDLDMQLEEVMKLVEVDPSKVVELSGPSHVRASRAQYEVSERYLCLR